MNSISRRLVTLRIFFRYLQREALLSILQAGKHWQRNDLGRDAFGDREITLAVTKALDHVWLQVYGEEVGPHRHAARFEPLRQFVAIGLGVEAYNVHEPRHARRERLDRDEADLYGLGRSVDWTQWITPRHTLRVDTTAKPWPLSAAVLSRSVQRNQRAMRSP